MRSPACTVDEQFAQWQVAESLAGLLLPLLPLLLLRPNFEEQLLEEAAKRMQPLALVLAVQSAVRLGAAGNRLHRLLRSLNKAPLHNLPADTSSLALLLVLLALLLWWLDATCVSVLLSWPSPPMSINSPPSSPGVAEEHAFTEFKRLVALPPHDVDALCVELLLRGGVHERDVSGEMGPSNVDCTLLQMSVCWLHKALVVSTRWSLLLSDLDSIL